MEFEDELSLEKYLAESVRSLGQNSNSSDDEGAEKEGRKRSFNSCDYNHGSSLDKEVLKLFPILTGQRRRRLKGSDLHRAVINADMEEIASLLKRGVPMEVQNSRGLTPLQVFEKLY